MRLDACQGRVDSTPSPRWGGFYSLSLLSCILLPLPVAVNPALCPCEGQAVCYALTGAYVCSVRQLKRMIGDPSPQARTIEATGGAQRNPWNGVHNKHACPEQVFRVQMGWHG